MAYGPFNVGSGSGSETIKGTTGPTKETVGKLGQHFLNTTTGKEYVCVNTDGGYAWSMTNATDAADINYNGRTVKEALEDLEVISMKTFGVQWDYSNPSTELTRLTRATDPNHFVTVDITEEPVPAVGTSAGSSPFDNYLPWAGMEEYNIENGVVTCARGDSNFSRTDKDTMVYIPKFYYHIEKDAANKKMRFYISDQPRTGFEYHPGSGRYVGRYPCGTGYVSKSGLAAIQSTKRSAARIGCTAKGEKWWQYDVVTYCAIWLLILVEYADWDSQKKIGKGNVYSGKKQNTGSTDTMVYHTGRAAGSDGNVAAQYRHIEEMWGNVSNWLDGINYNNYESFICLNPSKYADNVFSGDYISIGIKQEITKDFITELDVPENFPFAFVPVKGGGSDSTYIPDRSNVGSGQCVVCVGGECADGKSSGMCAVNASLTDSSFSSYICPRLLFIPGEE